MYNYCNKINDNKYITCNVCNHLIDLECYSQMYIKNCPYCKSSAINKSYGLHTKINNLHDLKLYYSHYLHFIHIVVTII